MTFLEAAIEVLQGASEALHFSEIAKRAVARKLLSHVGRDPESAMRTCLNSAVRSAESPLERAKPGHYSLRAGARAAEVSVDGVAPPVGEQADGDQGEETKHGEDADARPSAVPVFRPPSDSGLEGDTDVAIVMANAMSRLADERPELRDQLEAMQAPQSPATSVTPQLPRVETRRAPSRAREEVRVRPDPADDRGSRRRRRRRRRGRRVEWGEGDRQESTPEVDLLDRTAAVLAGAGARSMHVRQIAEALAAQNVLGGEISEIERAVTSAILLDVHRSGRVSRFCVRGDARYQLHVGRLPPALAKAEMSLHEAMAAVTRETETQFVAWLQSLGSRALESVIRLHLEHEGHQVISGAAPWRGLATLVIEEAESEDEERTLVLVVARKTVLDARSLEGEAQKHQCANTIVYAMGEMPAELGAEVRFIGANELASALIRAGIGVELLNISVQVLDAALIESIGGLDT